MPCHNLARLQDLSRQYQLPISDSDVLKVLCPVCGQVEVCAYTPLDDSITDQPAVGEDPTQGPEPERDESK